VLPFSNQEFDSVITNQVFEHVFNPDKFLSEINRVLKVGGLLLISVPFVWDEHEQPNDYARYSSFGLKFALEKSFFVVIESRKSVTNLGVIFQLLNSYIYNKTLTSNKYINLLSTLCLMAPVNILGSLMAKLLPNNNDLYLDNIVLAKKVPPPSTQ
jgi:SAM-dependent methyltransferase